jgi:hypothetical protein
VQNAKNAKNAKMRGFGNCARQGRADRDVAVGPPTQYATVAFEFKSSVLRADAEYGGVPDALTRNLDSLVRNRFPAGHAPDQLPVRSVEISWRRAN